MRVVVAFDSFKGSLSAREANEAFALYKTPGAVKGKLMLVNED